MKVQPSDCLTEFSPPGTTCPSTQPASINVFRNIATPSTCEQIGCPCETSTSCGDGTCAGGGEAYIVELSCTNGKCALPPCPPFI